MVLVAVCHRVREHQLLGAGAAFIVSLAGLATQIEGELRRAGNRNLAVERER